MSNIIKLAVLVGIVGTISACGRSDSDEVVIVEPSPIVAEPVSGKF